MTTTAHTAQWQIDEANKWVFENPYAWEYIKRKAREKVASHQRTSMRYLMQIARFELDTKGLCEGFKINNSITPVLARRLMIEVPEVSAIMETRKSKVDKEMSNGK